MFPTIKSPSDASLKSSVSEGNISPQVGSPVNNSAKIDESTPSTRKGRHDPLPFTLFTPDLINQLGMRELNTGETYSAYEQQKIYTHILRKDLKILRENKVYEKAIRLHQEKRKDDEFYKQITGIRQLGAEGNFDEVDRATTYNRWKLTSKPYGPIAHRKYCEWRDNITHGERADKIKELEQIRKVRMLWDDIRFHRDVNIEEKIKEQAKAKIEHIKTKEEQEEEEAKALENFRQIVNEGNFHKLHQTMDQLDPELKYRRTEKQWDKGFHPEFDIDRGFPTISTPNIDCSTDGVVKDKLVIFEPFAPIQSPTNRSKEMEKMFNEWNRNCNLKAVEEHFAEIQHEQDEQLKENRRKTIDTINKNRKERKRATLLEKQKERELLRINELGGKVEENESKVPPLILSQNNNLDPDLLSENVNVEDLEVNSNEEDENNLLDTKRFEVDISSLQMNKQRIPSILRTVDRSEQEQEELFIQYLINERIRIIDRNAYYRDLKEYITRKYESKKTYNVKDLVKACKDGSYYDVINILEHHRATVGPNDHNERGESVLMIALLMIVNNEYYPFTTKIKEFSSTYLYIRGVNLLKSPLKKRVWNNIEIILLILLLKGGDLNFIRKGFDGNENYGIIHMVVIANHEIMLSWLQSRGADMQLLSKPNKRSPLSLAVERDNLEMVLYLIRNGAMVGIDTPDSFGWTALHYAAAYARIDIVKILLLCGADSKLLNHQGLRPFEIAQTRGRYNVVDVIHKHRDPKFSYQKKLEFMDTVYMDKGEPKLLRNPSLVNANPNVSTIN